MSLNKQVDWPITNTNNGFQTNRASVCVTKFVTLCCSSIQNYRLIQNYCKRVFGIGSVISVVYCILFAIFDYHKSVVTTYLIYKTKQISRNYFVVYGNVDRKAVLLSNTNLTLSKDQQWQVYFTFVWDWSTY